MDQRFNWKRLSYEPPARPLGPLWQRVAILVIVIFVAAYLVAGGIASVAMFAGGIAVIVRNHLFAVVAAGGIVVALWIEGRRFPWGRPQMRQKITKSNATTRVDADARADSLAFTRAIGRITSPDRADAFDRALADALDRDHDGSLARILKELK
jgi:hypothetical protein